MLQQIKILRKESLVLITLRQQSRIVRESIQCTSDLGGMQAQTNEASLRYKRSGIGFMLPSAGHQLKYI